MRNMKGISAPASGDGSPRKKRSKPVLSIVLAALFAFCSCILVCSSSNRWAGWNSSHFPSKLRAVIFEKAVLDESHSVTWGVWNASLDSSRRPIVTYKDTDDGAGMGLWINTLVCTNRSTGTSADCYMFLGLLNRRQGRTWCFVAGDSVPKIEIKCPVDVQLEGLTH
jgi:hypothetical protein